VINTTSTPPQDLESSSDLSGSSASKPKKPESLKDIFPDLFGNPKPLMAL
jgi:hypothetical protein